MYIDPFVYFLSTNKISFRFKYYPIPMLNSSLGSRTMTNTYPDLKLNLDRRSITNHPRGHYLILTIDYKDLTMKLPASSPDKFVYYMRLLHSCLARSLDLCAAGCRGCSGDRINVYLCRTEDGSDQRFRVNRQRPGNQLRHIVDIVTRIVKQGGLLRRKKWLAGLTVGIDVADEDPGEYAPCSLAAEYDPAAVARPAMPCLRVFAVDRRLAIRPGLEVHEIEVAGRLIDRKTAVLGHAKQQEPAIR